MNNCNTACEPRIPQCQDWADRANGAVNELETRIGELEMKLSPVLRRDPPNPTNEKPELELPLVPVASVFHELWRKNNALIERVRLMLELLEI